MWIDRNMGPTRIENDYYKIHIKWNESKLGVERECPSQMISGQLTSKGIEILAVVETWMNVHRKEVEEEVKKKAK